MLQQIAKSIIARPEFISRDVTGDGKPETFCNFAVRQIAKDAFNYTALHGMTANQIYDFIAAGNGWRKVDGIQAHELAASCFVLAAQKGAAHGHVAVVLPDKMVMSGKWKKMVPQVANVGKTNGVMGVNFAFATEPDYFALI